MDALWTKGSGTVQQVLDSLPGQLAYNSVLTTIRVLERKGYVKHTKDGRAHIYLPVVARDEASRSAVRQLVTRFFRNSHELLVLNLLKDERIDADELNRLRQLLQKEESRTK
jgi:predicted transcriptional regulator